MAELEVNVLPFVVVSLSVSVASLFSSSAAPVASALVQTAVWISGLLEGVDIKESTSFIEELINRQVTFY